MTEFTRRPLAILDNIYRFVGGLKGVNRLNLTQDIQLVHDVARQGEKGGLGGYFGRIRWTDEISINGTDEKVITRPADVAPLLTVDNEQYELWITDVSGYVSTADLADMTEATFLIGCQGGSQFQNRIGTNQITNMPYAHFLAADFVQSCNSAGTVYQAVAYHPPQPIRVPPAWHLGVVITTTASANFHFDVELWAGPFGASPPGTS